MSTSKIAWAVVGAILIITTVMVFHFPQVFPTIRLVELIPVRGTAEITNTYQAVTAGPFSLYRINIKAEYQDRVYQDDTIEIHTLVKQEYYVSGQHPNQYEWIRTHPTESEPVSLKSLQWPIHLSLHGAAFIIDPVVHSFEIYSPLPLDVYWTALPKNAGTHVLLLDVSKIKPRADDYWRWHSHTYSTKAVVNGVEILPPQNVETTGFESPIPVSVLNLPVEVVTQWGFSKLWTDIITIVASIVAFVLSLPFLSAVVSWFLQRQRKRAES